MKNSVSNVVTRILAVAVALLGVGLLIYNTFFVKEKELVEIKQNSNTKVHFVNVGQGDAILITSGGKTMLVDTGDRDNSDRVVEYIKQNSIESIDYLVLTHPHTDHIGEAVDVLEQFPVEKIIMPKVPAKLTPTNITYKNLLKTIKELGKKVTVAKDGEFMLGDATIQMFVPKKTYSDLNNYSIILKVIDGSKSFLLMGDAEVAEEKELLASKYDVKADVLKAGHHGGATSTSGALLKAVAPEYVVFSAGRDNEYGHPDKKTVARVKKVTKDYFITYKDGSIIFNVSGDKLLISNSKG